MAFRLDRTAYKRVYVSRRRQLEFECNQDLNMYNEYSNTLLKEFVTIIWFGNKVLKFESDKKSGQSSLVVNFNSVCDHVYHQPPFLTDQ